MFQTASGPDRDDGELPARVRLRKLVGEVSAEQHVQPPVAAVVDPPDGGSGGDPPVVPRPRFLAVRRRTNRLIERWVPGGGGPDGNPPARRPLLVLCALAATAATLVSVALWLHRPAVEPAPPLPVAAGAPSARASGGRANAHADPAPSSAVPTTLVVSVVGKVAKPGLQTLPDGSRVADALRAAGGAHDGVDVSGLNLARRLSDGEQITVGGAAPAEDSGAGGVPSQPLSLNTATVAQLDSLPGVGPVTAQRIVAWRTKHGSFTSVDQLAEVDGLGPARVARLKPLVRL